MKKSKKYVSDFSALPIDDMKAKKDRYKSVLVVQKYSIIAKAQQYFHNRSNGLQRY